MTLSYTAPGSGAKLQDAPGNAAENLTGRAVTNDTAKPTVLIASDATFPTKDAFAVTFAFSADVTGFDAADVTVTNGTASAVTGSGTIYAVTVTPAADVDGDVTVSVSADAARASNGVGNAAASETFAVDTLAPGLSSAAVTGNALTLTYDEALDGSSVPAGADFAVTVDGTTVALAATNPASVSGRTVSLTLAAAVAPTDTVTLSYTAPGSGAKLQDAPGNAAENLTDRAVTNDTAKPTVAIASDAIFPTKDAFTVTLTFSADVTGFVAGDVTVTGGTASASFSSSTAAVYTIGITPDADVDGDVTVSVAADVATDGNGVGNAAASETFAVDTLAPGLSTAAVSGNTLVLTYDEALDGSSVPAGADFAVTVGGTTVALAATNPVSVSGRTVSLTLAAAVAPTDTVTLSYTAPGSGAKLQDELGNAAENLTGRAVTNDTAKPTVAIASDATFPTKDAFAVTLTFSADVTGFDAADVTVTKGTASGFSGSGTAYRVTVTPDADYAGDVTVAVSADAAADGNGVGNAAASETFAVDTLAPGLSSAAVTGNALTLTYDEALDGSSVPAGADFAVTVDGTTVALAATNPVTISGSAVTLTLVSAVAPTDTVTLSYTAPGSGAKLQDAPGNAAENLTDRAVTNDTAKPTVAIASDAIFPTKDAFTVTLTFSADVTGFVAGDVTVTGGTASASFSSSTAAVYTIGITPDADVDGDVTVSVAADVARASDGVGNAAASETFAVDTLAPGLSTAAVSGNTLVLTYDEALDGSSAPAASAYEVRAGPPGSLTTVALAATNPVSVSGRTVSLTLAAAVAPTDTVTLSYTAPGSGAKLQDELGNAAENLTGRAVTNDTAKPTVAIASDATFPTKDAFAVTLTFSADVTGFVAGDVTVTGGTVSASFSSSTAAVYTIGITPAADVDGDVTVSVSADAATDGNGVGNAAASETFAVDTLAPALSTATVTGNTLTLTYDEALDGSSVPAGADFAVTVGGTTVALAATNPVSVSGRTVSLTLAAAVAPTDTVTLSYTAPGSGAKLQDAPGNAAENLTDRAVTNDTAKPTVAIASDAIFPTKDAFTVTLTFSADVTGFVAGDVTVTGGTASASFSSSTAAVYTIGITPDADVDGDVTVSVAADVARASDGVGNAAASETFAVDTLAPGLSTAAVSGNTLVLTYDEALDGSSVPAGADFAVTVGGTTVALAATNPVSVSGRTVSLTLATAVAPTDTVTLSYTAPGSGAKLQDELGNAAENLTGRAVTNDTAKPTVAIASDATFPTKDAFAVTLTFSADVTGFDAADVTVTKGTASGFSGSGTAYRVTVTPDADYAGDVTVAVSADAAADGNGVGNAAASETFAVDTLAPGLSSAAVTGNALTLTYDEALDGSSVPAGADFAVTVDGTTVALAATNPVTISGSAVTLTLVSAVAPTDTVTLSYTAPASGKLQDAPGNAAENLTDRAVRNDTLAPTVRITSAAIFPTKDAFAVTLTFSADVTGFVAGDVTVTGGTASASFSSSTAAVYTIGITPDADYAGDVTVAVSADAATDGNGVGNASATETFAVDTLAPGLSTAAVSGNALVLTYDEDLDTSSAPAASAYEVRAGPPGSLTTVALAATNPVTISGSAVTLTLASAVAPTDTVTLSYTAPGSGAKLQDAPGNAAENLTGRAVTNDTAKPTVAIASDATFPTKDAFAVTFTFSADVTGFDAADVTVTNGTASAVTGSGTIYAVTVTPAADVDGDVTVSVSADTARASNGVGNAAASETFAVDTLAPGLSTAAVSGNTLVLTYDEALDGSSVPAGADFAVTVGGTTVALAATNPVSVSGRTVSLTLAAAVAPTDTVTLSYTAPGSGAKLQDAPGNAAENLTDRAVTNDTAKPTVAIASDAIFPTKDAFTVTLTFSADVTGFVAGDVTVTGGTASASFSSSTAAVYTIGITPAADVDGDVTVSVSADAAADGNGVGNAAASETFAVDTLAPALSTATVTGNTLTLTYDEALDGSSAPAASAYEVRAGPPGSLTTVALAATNPVTISGSAVTLTLASAVAQGDTVRVSYTAPGSGAKLQDAPGNAAENLTDRAVTNDTAKPTVAIASDATFPTKDAFAVTLTFSADVTGFDAADVTVTKGTASGFSGSGTAYRVTVTPDADYAGDVTVEVPADVAQASNGVGNASATETFAVDTLAPALSTATVTGNTLTLTYDEALDGSSVPAGADFAVTVGGTTVALAATNPVSVSGRTVSLTLAAAVAPTDTVTLSYTAPGSGAKLQDELGNAAENLTGRAVTNDTAKPTVAIASDATFPTKDAFAVTLTFSADVTGFVAGDVTVTGGTVSASFSSSTAAVYTIGITPAADVDGDVTVSVSADAATDGNGVGNAAASETFAVDTLAPALSTATVTGNTLTLTYDEALDGSSVPAGADFAVTVGGTTVALAATNPVSVSGRTVSLTLAAAVAPTDTVTLSYTAPGSGAKLQDAPGNAAENLTDRAVTNDTAKPTVAIASDAIFPTKDAFTVTLTFSADVTGFVAGDVTVTGGTASASFSSSTAAVYTIGITPDADVDGDVTVSVAADVARASDGVGNAAASETFAVDTLAPGLSTAAVSGNTLVLTYDEALDGSSVPAGADFAVTVGGTTVALAATNPVSVSGRTVSLTLATAVAPTDTVTLSYTAPGSGAKLQDELGNAAENLTGRAVTNDTAKPTVAIASDATFPTKDAFAVTLTFSADVTGFDAADVTVTKGTASGFSGSGTTYTVTVTPADDYAGDVTVSVSADAATDGNGVGNAAASETFAVDTLAPGLSTAAVSGNALVLSYDEALDGSSVPAASAYEVRAGPPGSLTTVALAATNPVTISGSAVTLTLASAVAQGDTVRVSYTAPGSGAKLQDELGNTAASLTDRAVTNDTAKPTVAIASDATFPTKDAFAVTLTFSADVTGFVAGDVTVTNGTASASFSSSTAAVYTIGITPAADVDGDVTVSVSADAATDGNGVGNAAASETFAVDTLAPGLSTAAVSGNALVLSYDEDLDTSSAPAASAYEVRAGPPGSLAAVSLAATNPVTILGSAVTLTLASAVAQGDVVRVSYTAPGSGAKLQDELGNAAASLTDRAVTNETAVTTTDLALTVNPTGVDEGAGATTITVTVAPVGSTTFDTNAEVTVTIRDGTAMVGEDFTAVSDFVITVRAGESTATHTFSFEPVDDAVDEGAGETVRVQGTTPQGNLAPVEITITDNDVAPAFSLVLSSNLIVENGDAVGVGGVLSHPSGEDIQVEVTVSEIAPEVESTEGTTTKPHDGLKTIVKPIRRYDLKHARAPSSAVTLSDTTFTIPAGERANLNALELTANDDNEDLTNLQLVVSARVTGDSIVLPGREIPLTFVDDDGEPRATLMVWPSEISERGGMATVFAVVQPPADVETRMEVSAAAVPPAGTDAFQLSAQRTLTLKPGAVFSEGRVTVAANEDTDADTDREVSVSGTIVGNDSMPDPDPVVLTIVDGSKYLPLLIGLVGDVYATEGDAGTRTLNFSVTLGQRVDRRVTVRYATEDVTADAGQDYESTQGMLTFEPGETSQSFGVAVRGDSEPEPDERFRVVLSAPTDDVILARQAAFGNIGNDDSTPDSGVDICSYGPSTSKRLVSIANASVREGEPARFRITMNRRRSCQDTSFWITTYPGTATQDTDYVGFEDYLVHLPFGETETVFEVPTVKDETNEDGETLWVRIRVAGSLWRYTPVERDTALGVILDADGPTRRILYLPAFNDGFREGFVRVVNPGRDVAEVEIETVDDAGVHYEPVRVEIAPGSAFHFNSNDLENGNPEKGFDSGIGPGQGDWRLNLYAGEDEIEAYAYLRTEDGFLTSLHDLVPHAEAPDGEIPPNETTYTVPIFNPAGNVDQVSLLRIVNAGEQAAAVTIVGIDDAGEAGGPVALTLDGGESRTHSAAELESGIGLDGSLGEGSGKWRLSVTSDRLLRVLSLLENPTGHVTNLSSMPRNRESMDNPASRHDSDDYLHRVFMFPEARNADNWQGLVRVVNTGDVDSQVTIDAEDETEWDYEPVVLQLGAGESVNFTSEDLEDGNEAKGLSRGVGSGDGYWRLNLVAASEIEVLSYIRTRDGFLTAMHDVVPDSANGHAVPIFNPAQNIRLQSLLHLVNTGSETALVTITGVDDRGDSGGKVRLSLPAGESRMITAQELESGAPGLEGQLDDGVGKWRLMVAADRPVHVMNLLNSQTGHLTNLSTMPE